MLRIAFVGRFAATLEPAVRERLRVPCDVVLAGEDEAPSRLADVDVAVTLSFTREMGAAARRLRLVQVPGAGLDRIDAGALPAGAALANVHGHETGIAEFVLGAILALRRDLLRLDAALRRGRWESQWAVGAPAPPPWPELAGTTLGILGYGAIGRALARRARALDMTVHAVRRRPEPDAAAIVHGPDGIDDVLERADHVALALPLTPETRGLLDARRLGLLGPRAILVNVARAEIVDEDALHEALAGGRLAGAALDVWYRYPAAPGATPPSRRPFHELPNVLMTPHVSGWTEGMLAARAALIAENVHRASRGEPPLNRVTWG